MTCLRSLLSWGALLVTAAPLMAQTPSLALTGVSGDRALLVINGAPPKFLSAGQTHNGVKLLSVSEDSVTVEVNGQRQSLEVGAAPVSVGRSTAGPSGQRIVLTADPSGHFVPDGQINGKTVKFMVDTGATTIAISAAEAKRINLAYDQGKRIQMVTANGPSAGYLIRLQSVRIGDVVAYDVDAVVSPVPMPFVLLGNSFLNRFQMQKTNDQLTLEKRF